MYFDLTRQKEADKTKRNQSRGITKHVPRSRPQQKNYPDHPIPNNRMKIPKVKNRTFKFVSETEIKRNHIDITAWQSTQLRAKLQKSVYWIQPIERGKIHWNIDLLLDYLINGDRPEHQTLLGAYIATLPKTD